MSYKQNETSIIKNLKLWICVFFCLMVIGNFVFFVIYQQSHKSEDIATQLWNYFESNTFQGLMASLVGPIVFFFLENKLRFIDSYKQNRLQEREKFREEQIIKHDLIQSHLSQFGEISAALLHRHHNLLYLDGRKVMKERDDGYYLNSHFYALACFLAYDRIFQLDGIYPKIGHNFQKLDETIREEINNISASMDRLGKKYDVEFFRYDQLALAETAMEQEETGHRISSNFEFRKKQVDQNSLEYTLIRPAINFLESLFTIR